MTSAADLEERLNALFFEEQLPAYRRELRARGRARLRAVQEREDREIGLGYGKGTRWIALTVRHDYSRFEPSTWRGVDPEAYSTSFEQKFDFTPQWKPPKLNSDYPDTSAFGKDHES